MRGNTWRRENQIKQRAVIVVQLVEVVLQYSFKLTFLALRKRIPSRYHRNVQCTVHTIIEKIYFTQSGLLCIETKRHSTILGRAISCQWRYWLAASASSLHHCYESCIR